MIIDSLFFALLHFFLLWLGIRKDMDSPFFVMRDNS